MSRETNTIRTKDDRDNGVVLLLILFLFLFELGIGFLTYLNGPILVAGKPNIKLAGVGITIQDVDTASTEINTEVEQVPEEPKRAETIIYEEPKKQVFQIKAPEVKPDEPAVQPVVQPEATSTTFVATSSPVIAPEQASEPAVATSSPDTAVGTYTLSYTAGDGGRLVGSTTQVVTNGGTGTEVIAMPNSSYQFFNWSDDSTVNPRTDTSVTANMSVTANFVFIYSRNKPSSAPSASLSNIATITSGTYTVSAGGTANETVTGVPFATDKATFLAALTKGQANQSWNDIGINDPVVSNDTLVVTAQNGTTVVTYTVTVNDPPPPGGPG